MGEGKKGEPKLKPLGNHRYGQGTRRCRVTGNQHGLIRKYGIFMCRQSFREHAEAIGFKKI